MNSTKLTQQLHLAADIIEANHPWELECAPGVWRKPKPGNKWETPLWSVANDARTFPIRIAFATPPDDRPLHNPNNLTAEQVGIGYRLALVGEEVSEEMQVYRCYFTQKWQSIPEMFYGLPVGKHHGRDVTVRLPLSVPWPEPVDLYAELKAAHAAGKVIQFRSESAARCDDWSQPMNISAEREIDWSYPVSCFRVKPEPIFQLPPPPPGMQWHRTNGWQAGDLPPGYRPLIINETRQDFDDVRNLNGWHSFIAERGEWPCAAAPDETAISSSFHTRTTRPLIFTLAGQEWTYHRPGDVMPCEGDHNVAVVFSDGSISKKCHRGDGWSWTRIGDDDDIVGWRYADPQMVPLGPEDVRCGDEIRHILDEETCARAITEVKADHVFVHGIGPVSYNTLGTNYKIRNRFSNAWERCYKQSSAKK